MRSRRSKVRDEGEHARSNKKESVPAGPQTLERRLASAFPSLPFTFPLADVMSRGRRQAEQGCVVARDVVGEASSRISR